MFDWDDGTNSGWLGPYISDDTVIAFKTWTEKGTYSVKIKAMDIYLYEGAWSDVLSVNIPRSRAISGPLLSFLENYPGMFTLLRLLLERFWI